MIEKRVVRFYKCDPNKNVDCPKSIGCGTCGWTSHPEFSTDGIAYVYNPNTERWEPENVCDK